MAWSKESKNAPLLLVPRSRANSRFGTVLWAAGGLAHAPIQQRQKPGARHELQKNNTDPVADAGDHHALAAPKSVIADLRHTRGGEGQQTAIRSPERPARDWNSVGTGPGQSAVTLMPRGESS